VRWPWALKVVGDGAAVVLGFVLIAAGVVVHRGECAEIAGFVIGAIRGVRGAEIFVFLLEALHDSFDARRGRIDVPACGLDVVAGDTGEDVAWLLHGSHFHSERVRIRLEARLFAGDGRADGRRG
jgi:hypothetical protein